MGETLINKIEEVKAKILDENTFHEKSKTLENFMKDYVGLFAEIPNIPQNKQGYGYKYADLGTTLELLKPVLKKYNFGLPQIVQTVGANVVITTMLIHSSGEYIKSIIELPPTNIQGTNQIQKMGASITYARRYAIASLVGASTEEDTDGDRKDKPNKELKRPQNNQNRNNQKPLPPGQKGQNPPNPEEIQNAMSVPQKISQGLNLINSDFEKFLPKLSDANAIFMQDEKKRIEKLPKNEETLKTLREFYDYFKKEVKSLNEVKK